jgi:hypothetical protein
MISSPGLSIPITYSFCFFPFSFLGTTVCPPCDNELKSEAIIEHLCASEFGKTVFLATSWGSGILAFPCPVSLVNREPGGGYLLLAFSLLYLHFHSLFF